MRTMNKCLYIVEGEIEERFIKQLKELDWIIPGRISRFNLMQKKLKKTDNILSKRMDYIYCIKWNIYIPFNQLFWCIPYIYIY